MRFRIFRLKYRIGSCDFCWTFRLRKIDDASDDCRSEEITSGELWIDGQLCNYVEAKDRDLSMVFQNYALYPNMTVYENMAFSMKIRKQPKDEVDKKVHEAAKMLGIEHLLDRRPAALSGGQKQRVAIGSAIMRRPKAFLMDEPLSNLDAKLRAQMRWSWQNYIRN